MTEVYRRKLALYKYTPTLTAVTLFYSRIILKKLTTENKTTFRKLEKSVKFSVKCDADIKFINCIFCPSFGFFISYKQYRREICAGDLSNINFTFWVTYLETL